MGKVRIPLQSLMGKVLIENISKDVSSKHSQKLLDQAKQSADSRRTKVATDAFKTTKSDIYSATSRSTGQYYKDEPTLNAYGDSIENDYTKMLK